MKEWLGGWVAVVEGVKSKDTKTIYRDYCYWPVRVNCPAMPLDNFCVLLFVIYYLNIMTDNDSASGRVINLSYHH